MKLTVSTRVDDLRKKARTSLIFFILILKVFERKTNLCVYFLLPLHFDSCVSKCFRVSSVNLITVQTTSATEGSGWENLRFRGDRGSWTSRARRRRSLHFDTAGSDIHSLRSHSYFLTEKGERKRRDNVLTPPFYEHNATLTHRHARTQNTHQ